MRRIIKDIVALRKESVDRNSLISPNGGQYSVSLSARRAWIEISRADSVPYQHVVALRKESVDRNVHVGHRELGALVALRKESVDRNTTVLH